MDGKVDAGLLIFVNVILQLCFSKLIEGYDYQGNKDVDKKEWEDNKEDNVEDGLLSSEPGYWPLVLIC